jgi:hypothetical protein
MKRATQYSFQGEVKTIYQNKYFNSYEGETNFRISTPKMAFDLMYDASRPQDHAAFHDELPSHLSKQSV